MATSKIEGNLDNNKPGDFSLLHLLQTHTHILQNTSPARNHGAVLEQHVLYTRETMQQAEERRLEKHTRFGAGTNSKTTTKKCSSSSSSSDRNTSEAAGKNAAGILMNARRSDNIIGRRDTRLALKTGETKKRRHPDLKMLLRMTGGIRRGFSPRGRPQRVRRSFESNQTS